MRYSSWRYKNSRLYTTVSIIMYFLPVRAESSTILRQSATLVAIGTVQATCLPASSADSVIAAWSGIGVLMCTKSTSGSRRTSA